MLHERATLPQIRNRRCAGTLGRRLPGNVCPRHHPFQFSFRGSKLTPQHMSGERAAMRTFCACSSSVHQMTARQPAGSADRQLQAADDEWSSAESNMSVRMKPMQSSRRRAIAVVTSAAIAVVRTLQPADASMLGCPGLNGRPLQQCLKKARQERQLEEDRLESEAPVEGDKRKYENLGELITTKSGVQYREMETGTGPEATVGSICGISYVVYRLASGAYFKYSSGGTPVYMWDYGFGIQDKSDLGSTYDFTLGEKGTLPAAAAVAVKGMRVGGRRRILVPPAGGWIESSTQPRPPNFGGSRRLAAHYDEPLLFEAQLVRVRTPSSIGDQPTLESPHADDPPGTASPRPSEQAAPYKLPTPPIPAEIRRRAATEKQHGGLP